MGGGEGLQFNTGALYRSATLLRYKIAFKSFTQSSPMNMFATSD